MFLHDGKAAKVQNLDSSGAVFHCRTHSMASQLVQGSSNALEGGVILWQPGAALREDLRLLVAEVLPAAASHQRDDHPSSSGIRDDADRQS